MGFRQVSRGRRLALSPPRRVVLEVLTHALKAPLVPVARKMDLRRVAAARVAAIGKPSWTTLFVRAFGIVSSRHPPLRRTFMQWPFPHLYEHPDTVCAVAVERQWNDEPAIFFGNVLAPERQDLAAIQRRIHRYRERPIEEIGRFRRQIFLGRCPWLIRRAIVWGALHLSGPQRVYRFGTFGVTNYGQWGAESLRPIAPITALLTLGPIDEDDRGVVKIVYDHRVLDGAFVARCLAELEDTLNTQIAQELACGSSESCLISPCACAA
jgi:hypothetical protein